MFKIYYLEENGVPFYVGKAKNPVKRKYKHRHTYGPHINLHILDEVEDWRYWEEFYIWLFKSWGFILKNKNNGGGGPTYYTEEQKLKMRGRKLSQESKDKISKSLIEGNHSKYYTPEIKKKISDSMKGRKVNFTPEHIENIKESRRKNSKRVIQYNFQGEILKEWKSKGEAAEYIIKTKDLTSNVVSQIKDCILGRQKTAFGYIWRYKGDERKLDIFPIIYQFDLDRNITNEFKSMSQLREWVQENHTYKSTSSITYSINKHSQYRIYKSGNYYYSTKNQI